MKKIKLTQGKYTTVDNEDYDYYNRLKWHLSGQGYAVRRYSIDGKNTTIYMHRLIAKTPRKLFTDHINRDRLDNRRINLKVVTWAENRLNVGKHKDNKHGERNIDFVVRSKRWRVRMQRYKKQVFQSYHVLLSDAIISRDKYYGKSEV